MVELTEENKNNAFIIYRFSPEKYMNSLLDGDFNFGCPGKYIEEAITEGNNEQGDKYEAVFARLKHEDHLIQDMKDLLKDDLEIIEDGEYVLLRRESAKLVSTFCFFNYIIEDLRKGVIGEPKNGLLPITLEFDEKMYSGFSDKSNENGPLTITAIYTHEFIKRAKEVINSESGIKSRARMREVDYQLRGEKTFFIPPSDSYDELFYKRPKYDYQHEGRIVLPGIRLENIERRYSLKSKPFDRRNVFETQVTPLKLIIKCSLNKDHR